MINKRYNDAMAETLYYLNGVCQEDKDRIPEKLIDLFKVNASKDYICDFDYRKPLNELNLLPETKGFLGMIALNYLCDTEEQKQMLLKKFHDNEIKYQQKLKEKYNEENIFKNYKKEIKVEEPITEDVQIIEYKETIFNKIMNFIKKILGK